MRQSTWALRLRVAVEGAVEWLVTEMRLGYCGWLKVGLGLWMQPSHRRDESKGRAWMYMKAKNYYPFRRATTRDLVALRSLEHGVPVRLRKKYCYCFAQEKHVAVGLSVGPEQSGRYGAEQ